jgi:integrase
MKYNPEKDLWFDKNNKSFIKNSFDPSNELFIEINSEIWEVNYQGNRHYINWDKINLPENIKNDYKKIAKLKFQKKSAHYIGKTRVLLDFLSFHLPSSVKNISDLNIKNILEIWGKMNPNNRIFFREYYKEFAEKDDFGANIKLYYEIKTWQARTETLNLKDVLYWNESRGALTKDEEKVFRDFLKNEKTSDIKEMSLILFGWLLLETIKRPSQILSMKKDSLRIVGKAPNEEYYVVIKPVKYQTGSEERWWRISKELGEKIIEYKDIKEVNKLQSKYDKLLVSSSDSMKRQKQISTAIMGEGLRKYISDKKIISPRTGEILHIKPLRLRHTGATRLAFIGIARDIIQEVLEHDSPESAKAYVDAVGSELISKLERSDRNMGSVFAQFEHAYFNGKIVDKSEKPPIIVPKIESTPLIVGSCSKNTLQDGACGRHPFLSCYNGCPHFLAWRETDHYKSLDYVEQEIKRWESFLSDGDNHAPLNEYKKVRDSIIEVIEIIEDDRGL